MSAAEPRGPKSELQSLGLTAKRSFGQNFLADKNIARRIAELAAEDAKTVVELGAGMGALTAPLLAHPARVIAVERDRDLVPYLHARFAAELAAGRLQVHEADAKTFDYPGAFQRAEQPIVLTGNLPYQLTGPLLSLTAGLARELCRAVYMVQLEVAQRVVAAPGEADYGALSVFMQAAFRCERALTVRRTAFYPQPRVDSAVLRLTRLETPIAEETPLFRQLVRQAFEQRRKTLRNAWRALGLAEVEAAAARADISLDLRGEALHARDFARMERCFTAVGAP
ncbi:MAG: ribosomal RNA small subunit methyltransferase A [Polyangiaceae bacterium]|nr:ribosomal RNA small subunit methyltransferase A [Polyangiaceae bacterium]MCW5790708.1 ribosomal RNA small subunit methyltransferase A [Polyangiaceae bacterium]